MTAPASATDRGIGPVSNRRNLHRDRLDAGPGLVAAVGVACAGALAVAGYLISTRGRLDPQVGLVLGAAAGALAVLGLPSVSLRVVGRLVAVASAGLLVRFASVGVPRGDSFAIAAWVVAVVAILVLTQVVAEAGRPGLGTDQALAPGLPAPPQEGARISVGAISARIGLVSAMVIVLVVLVLPLLLPHLDASAGSGHVPRPAQPGDPVPLADSERLDMADRPRLSDRVVMTIRSSQATFWRQQTFDRWDGRYWTRSDPTVAPIGPGGQVVTAPDDLAAEGTDVISQRVRIEAPYAASLPAAASAVRVDAPGFLAQRPDGSLLTEPALGAGATYTVESRRIPLSEDRLRAAAGTVPDDVRARYAAAPTTTDRVRDAATQVAAGARSTYDKVVALEAWMGQRTAYSLDAPLAPLDADVVDDFLFESRRGWCEQIASSLVVMARVNGIPARLVTGFVPGDRNPVTDELQVRERDAHSWAEVWFPEVGWVPFDPTADVPLAGDDEVMSWSDWVARHALWIVGGVALVVAGGLGVVVLSRRLARQPRPHTWAGETEGRLDALGARAGRPREPWETATTYAAALADRLALPSLAGVGTAIDAGTYAPEGPPEAERSAAEAALERARSRAPAGSDATRP